MKNENISTRILRTQHARIWAILGYPQKSSVEKYVKQAVEEKLVKDEKKKK